MHKSGKGKFEEMWKNAFEGAELTPSESHWDAIELMLSQVGGQQANFETSWKKEFKNAVINPSEEVWKAIDVALVQSENAGMKKSIVIYQRIAAAAVGILMMFGAYAWYKSDFFQKESIARDTKSIQESESDNVTKKSSENQPLSATNSESENTNLNNSSDNENSVKKSEKTLAEDGRHLNRPITSLPDSKSLTSLTEEPNSNRSVQPLNPVGLNNVKKLNFFQGPISELRFADVSKLPNFFGPNDYSIAYRLADARPAVISQRKKSAANESKWAAVGFSTGTFSPGVSGGEMLEASSSRSNSFTASNLATAQASPSNSEKVKSGSSMTFAIAAGKRIFRKWILQGGFSYLNQNATTESNALAVAPANQVYDLKASSFAPETTNAVTYNTHQEINSSYQFISVPVQVGYMIVDRRFGVQINGGLSPDVFLKNSVYNQVSKVETTNTATDNGDFNAVSISGLGGIEFSYKFLDHYRLSLTPGVRYSLTPIYSENSLASIKPFVADLGLRFKYIF